MAPPERMTRGEKEGEGPPGGWERFALEGGVKRKGRQREKKNALLYKHRKLVVENDKHQKVTQHRGSSRHSITKKNWGRIGKDRKGQESDSSGQKTLGRGV